MAFDLDNHPALLRCYRMNKDKPRAKLVARMKLLVPSESNAKASVGAMPKEPPSKPRAAPRSDPPKKQAATPKKQAAAPKKANKAPPARTIPEEYQQRIAALYQKHNQRRR